MLRCRHADHVWSCCCVVKLMLCGHAVVVWSCCCCVVVLMLCGHAPDLHDYRCRGLNPGILTPSLPTGQHMTQEKSIPFEYFDVHFHSEQTSPSEHFWLLEKKEDRI